MEKVKYNEQGICPFCGEMIEYVDNEINPSNLIAYWNCPHCGATGEEVYSFIGHFNCTRNNCTIESVEDEMN